MPSLFGEYIYIYRERDIAPVVNPFLIVRLVSTLQGMGEDAPPPSDNLYVKGLPRNMSEAKVFLAATYNQWRATCSSREHTYIYIYILLYIGVPKAEAPRPYRPYRPAGPLIFYKDNSPDEKHYFHFFGGWDPYFEKLEVRMKKRFSPKGQQIDEFDICIMCSGAQNRFRSNPLTQSLINQRKHIETKSGYGLKFRG